jgi:DNA-binding HxlR family transcriptional regulator
MGLIGKVMKNLRNDCPIEGTLAVIGGKWKAVILWHLRDQIRRFGELKKMIPGITQKMLAQQLREMERDGIIKRKVYPQIPPKVEYSLTDCGKSLCPILEMMAEWGSTHNKMIAKLKREQLS